MSNHLSYHHQAYYTYIEMYIQMYNAMCHMDTWGNFWSATKPIIFVIKRTILVPGVCPCIRIRSMMHYVHTREAVVTSIKVVIFLLVTTRPIAHSGRFVCIWNCVCEFGMDTGQPLVTSNVMSNHLSYHHKAYYTYIEMSYKCIMLCAIWTPEIILISNKTYHQERKRQAPFCIAHGGGGKSTWYFRQT